MSVNICTRESMMADAIDVTDFCLVCGRDNVLLRIGWLDIKCTACGKFFSTEECNRIIKSRRDYLGLSVAEMAAKVGLKPQTVRQYEKIWPSKKYYFKTLEFVKEASQ